VDRFGARRGVVIDRTQSNKFAAQDYERFTEALREGWIKHNGQREFTRHVLNAIARVLPMGDARFERPVQSRVGGEQDRRVIDALSAAAMVHSVAAGEQEQVIFHRLGGALRGFLSRVSWRAWRRSRARRVRVHRTGGLTFEGAFYYQSRRELHLLDAGLWSPEEKLEPVGGESGHIWVPREAIVFVESA
jgi:hypothetical protein